MTKKYETLVLIGRFQPVTVAHQEIIRRAISLTRDLLIIVGSANQPRTFKNPFSYAERKMMLQNTLDQMDVGTTRVHIEPNIDTIYNDTAWANRIQGIHSKYKCLGGATGIIGHKKDESSFYFDMFPQWEFEEVGSLEPLNASNVRDLYFRKTANMKFVSSVLPQPVYRMLEGWKDTPEFNAVVEEREFVEKYKQQWAAAPYPVIFSTADACVTCSGHILLVKRKAVPGKGLWALPGGYVNANTDKSVQDAMIRELREETGIKVPAPVLVGNIRNSKVFDAIDRSPRGRIITHCFHVQLPDGELPKVKGADDAEKARWVPISEVTGDKMFEDHYEIILSVLGIS